MTVEERLLFIRAGYSARDIAGFEAAETTPATAPAPDPTQATAPAPDPAPATAPAPDPTQATAPAPDPAPATAPAPDPALATAPAADMPAWAVALQKSLDDLTRATQAANARFDDMGDPLTIQQEADNALAEYLTGTKLAKAAANAKTHTGGKRK